ncbi:MAG: tRNA (guanosine(46)-N7)-methyltransferase TrmB [Desulfuromonas sp.]|nr:MAG: tRNA (guanosine(46)-N7)-methyltransferase TrmB [Desulfuromonas sp.]
MQRMIHITSPVFLREPAAIQYGIPAVFPQPERPLHLEIGCGTGDFVVELAQRSPEINFLAIDIFNKGCSKTCNKTTAAGLENIRVMRTEARYLLTRLLPAESLDAIYVNCPDPWPKKRHRYRRLVNRDFFPLLQHALIPGGEFFFVTDFGDYAEQVAELLPTLNEFDNQLDSPYATDFPDYPVSKYMKRFLDLGQNLHYIHLQKKLDALPGDPPAPTSSRGFRINWEEREAAKSP